MTKRNRILLWVVGLATIIGAYAWFFGPSTLLAIEVRYFARKYPIMYEVPSVLYPLEANEHTGMKLSYFGYSFEVPWNDTDEAKSRLTSQTAVSNFRSGKSVIVIKAPKNSLVQSLLAKADHQSVEAVYGTEALQSDYVFFSQILNVTPQQVTPFTPRPAAIRNSTFLIMKGVMLPTSSGIYFIQNASVKGFQYGIPGKDKSITLKLYADSGGLELIFTGKSSGAISQEDINRVIQTFQETEHSQTEAGQ